ncbi:MAG: DUF167 domain-containing protein [Dehalococcoidales bacterium]|nr:MAG: DUF167 domain-containing protein [Dehalococcoidales bacterium]
MNEEQAKLNVHVHPGSSKNIITSYVHGILNVKITTRPEKGKANEALVTFIGDLLGIAKSRIKIQKGIVSRKKVLLIDGLNTEEISSRIIEHMNE